MGLSLGILGLPNVGKSTLFNALTKNSVPAENYPFCTIDPNVGRVFVKDLRLDKLASIEHSLKTIYAYVDFVDIAGLVKGASEGEGLGNKFLSQIQNVDALVHVVRAFESSDIIHVNNKVDPKSDIETINTELILKDIEILSKVKDNFSKLARTDPKKKGTSDFLERLNKHLQDGHLAKEFYENNKHEIEVNEFLEADLKTVNLITTKKVIYVMNIKEEDIGKINEDEMKKNLGVASDSKVLALSLKLESELSLLDDTDRTEFMKQYGLEISGLDKLIKESYSLLGLTSFFTTGPDESRAWTITKGSNAREAAGKIHTDFYDKFIAAEVISYDDFVALGGEKLARDAGKIRLESRDYIVKEADIMNFKHGA
ncbi:MAG: redox-regulated ATPase YchF [bacterium]